MISCSLTSITLVYKGWLGGVNWMIFTAFTVSWVIVYFSVWKGIKLSGKIAYFTVLSPYILFLILILKIMTLPGSVDGLKYLFIPKPAKLFSIKCWYDSLTQNLFTSNLGYGTVFVYATFRDKKFKVFKSCLM